MHHNTIHELDLPGRMTPTDALFWYAESALPNLRPVIGGLYLLDQTPDPARIEGCIDTALRVLPRLRQRVVEVPLNLGLPEWIEDTHLDRSFHVRHISLPTPGGQRELLDVASQLFAVPLDRERPLWDATLIDGLEGGRAALLFRMHHSVVDGVGSIAIFDAMTQTRRDAPPPKVVRRRRKRSVAAGGGSLVGLAVDNVVNFGRSVADGAALSWQSVTQPAETFEWIQRTARGLRGVIADASHPMVPDPLLRSTSGLSRRLDVMDVPIARLRAIKTPLGVTLNDVVLAAVAGCLHAYHRERHVRVDALNCMVPMSLRGRSERDRLGNRVGMFSIRLPVGEKTPAKRLARIVEQTHAAKSDKRSAAYPALIQGLTYVPGAVFRVLARQALGRVNLVCTNVPGIAEQRYMAGAAIEAVFPLVAIVEGTPLAIALLSYNGRLDIGIDSDPEAIPNPHRLGELLAEAFDELEGLAAQRSRAADR